MILPACKKVVILPERAGVSFIRDAHAQHAKSAGPLHATYSELMVMNPDYQVGGFCRNPFTKVVSLFNWRINDNSAGDRGRNGELAGEFEQWIRTRLKFEPSCFARMQCDGKVTLDFLGKFETLKEDFERLGEWTGIKGLKYFVSCRGSYKCDPEEYFTPGVVECVKKYWGPCFERFGYSEDFRDAKFRHWNLKVAD